MLLQGTHAPSFSLLDQNNNSHTEQDLVGVYTVLYFYPKDDTPGCTKEACMIRDVWDDFAKKNIQVFGISKDNPASHKAFKEKYDLPFTLLSDTTGTTCRAYEALSVLHTTKRITYIINPQGVIVKTYADVDPATHALTLLQELDTLI